MRRSALCRSVLGNSRASLPLLGHLLRISDLRINEGIRKGINQGLASACPFSAPFLVFEVSSSQLNNLERTTRDTTNERTWLWENTLTYDKTWDNVRLNALVGQSAQEYNYKRRNTVNEVLQPNGELLRDRAMMSYLSRVNATFFDRYLLTASLRADGSSRFSRNNRWGYFPSVAAGWNVAQEPFMRQIEYS